MGKQELLLTWTGKDHRPKLEPRVLVEDAERSNHAARRVSEQDQFDFEPDVKGKQIGR